MTTGDHTTIAALLGREIGLRLDGATMARLGSCLRDMAIEGATTVEAVTADIHRDPSARQQLIDRITVQESWFFRDPAQLDALARRVLPVLPRPVRIWVAGCGNGQEAYSIAMVLSEANHPDGLVIATDVSTAALDRTGLGRYHERELRGLSAERRARFLRPCENGFAVTDDLRQRLVVQQQNLVAGPLPVAPGSASVVFCRNVIIYFRREEMPGAVSRVAGALSSGGLLFSGVSEAQWQLGGHFELARLDAAFVYRLAAPQQAAPRSPVPASTSRPRLPRQRPRQASLDPPPGPGIAAAAALRAGEQAAAAGDQHGAIVLFRQAAYLDPALPKAHLHLGMALEAVGDHPAAARAYSAAQRSLESGGTLHDPVPGYSTDALRRHLDVKLAGRETPA